MRGLLTTCLASTALVTAPASAASLPARAARSALRADLQRAYGIRHVVATCTRRSPSAVSCRWRGRAPSGGYRGRATVRRPGRRTIVSLSEVRRTG